MNILHSTEILARNPSNAMARSWLFFHTKKCIDAFEDLDAYWRFIKALDEAVCYGSLTAFEARRIVYNYWRSV